jgi:hypothetical protein
VTIAAPDNLTAIGRRIAADDDARFAISLDRLSYAKDSYILGVDLVRIYARSAPVDGMGPDVARNVATLLRGLQVLTGRTTILGTRYGASAVDARDAGGSLFDFETDDLARTVVASIAASNDELASRVKERAAKSELR